jgi:hypothetical protein
MNRLLDNQGIQNVLGSIPSTANNLKIRRNNENTSYVSTMTSSHLKANLEPAVEIPCILDILFLRQWPLSNIIVV